MITPHLPGGGELMQDVVYLLTKNDTILLNLPAFTRTYQLRFTSITFNQLIKTLWISFICHSIC